ncbi:hypothetical protein BDV95DRAFT_600688 [Massariosphaeria phaeospora]|uniref:SUR7/PalI family-domain-containing protein n=1 Tax=Massariosphaeria phaeospora TaxID=100035 RepID=A0A7C8IFC4_9PLEO|nr:hypothetical protein BDV95DRAFT_600688 [Massariosphaeria phaeospora]
MGTVTAVLTGLRLLVIFVAFGVIGLGAWIQHTIHDIEIRGSVVLELTQLEPPQKEDAWRAFFTAVLDSQLRIWIAIAAGCFTFLAALLTMLSIKTAHLKISPRVLIPLELLSTLTMGGALAATTTLAVRLVGLSGPNLDTSSSSDLMAFGMLGPLSKGYAIATGVACALLLLTTLTSLTYHLSHRSPHRSTPTPLSFEPTASALGMSHGFQAVQPSAPRTTIPTIYDPLQPIPGTAMPMGPSDYDDVLWREKLRGLRPGGRRDSGVSGESGGSRGEGEGDGDGDGSGDEGRHEKEISGPLALQRPEVVARMRPARPWSEAGERRA